ncbi:MAG: YggS family pyridoxal phosphate-dependent enzyme [Fimbriimonadaceae bacterium]|nr:YggS family pyridoxal phosphate-dependent enzyme [Fimbriimonadaceae bacterium]
MDIARNLAQTRAAIEAACASVERSPSEVTLIAVSKNIPLEAIKAAYDAGQRHFGESRLQEAQPKIQAMPPDAIWHFIGHLQSNKAKKVAGMFDAIHTLDSESQLKEIAKADRIVDGFIEVNIGDEPQKAGISAESLDEFKTLVLNYPQVRLSGLMTIGPEHEDPESARIYFRRLRELGQRLGVSNLSMGMSLDFAVAIQEGATHVRIGSAIFGSRT